MENLDFGSGDFYTKLETQLKPAPPEAVQLAAEMFWVLFLFPSPSSMWASTKRVSIARIWEWSGEPIPENEGALGAALENGIGTTGAAYNTFRWKEFEFFIVMMLSWKSLAQNEQIRLLKDPWIFAAWMEDQERVEARQFRHILLHLLFPEVFEPISSGAQKRRLTEAFSKRYNLPQVDSSNRIALDRRINSVRERAEKEFGTPGVHFWESPFKEQWQDTGGGSEPERDAKAVEWFKKRFSQGERIWLWSPGSGARKWGEFQNLRVIGIGWDYLGDLMDYPSKEAVVKAIMANQKTGIFPTNSSLACWQFSREMRPGDVVIAKKGSRELLGYGVIASDYEFQEERPEFKHIHRIEWQRIGKWDLPKDRRVAVKVLTEFTSYKTWLHESFQMMDSQRGREEGNDIGEDPREGLFIPEAKFSEMLDTLARKKNIILQGPPGVGKTFIARRLAWALAGGKDQRRVQLIQFHQSYGYEDFMQGYRPAGTKGFELRNGIFHLFATAAQQNPENPYVLIIDEINRGNLSRILGELMMLIESDKRGEEFAIPLTYSLELFYVPHNLHLIGTMNTADRSLAMVDYALRRRFAFVDLIPAFGSDLFTQFLADRGVEESVIRRITERMNSLNRTIAEDRDLGSGFEVGHSYFCPQEEDEELGETWYEMVVRREIAPLLREYWFDRSDVTESELERLLS